MDLSIIIVSWNTREKLKKNLSHLFLSETRFSFEVFVVDNASSDGTARMVAEEFPQVNLISNSANLGFSRANNQAFKLAQGEYVLFFNPDMKVVHSTLDNMVQWMKLNRQATLAGCRLLNSKNLPVQQASRFPGLIDQLAIILKLRYFFPSILNGYLRTNFDCNTPQRVETIRGSFMMLDKKALKDVLSEKRLEQGQIFDERYFVWFEDVDLCRTFKEAGLEVWYTPAATCIDEVGASFCQLTRIKAQNYFRDSMLKYFKKWHSGLEVFILLLAWPFGLVLTAIFSKLKNILDKDSCLN